MKANYMIYRSYPFSYFLFIYCLHSRFYFLVYEGVTLGRRRWRYCMVLVDFKNFE